MIIEILFGGRYHAYFVAVYDDGCEVSSEEHVNLISLDENTINAMIYPNPVKDFVKIVGKQIKQLRMYNTSGQLMLSQDINDDETTVNTVNLGLMDKN